MSNLTRFQNKNWHDVKTIVLRYCAPAFTLVTLYLFAFVFALPGGAHPFISPTIIIPAVALFVWLALRRRWLSQAQVINSLWQALTLYLVFVALSMIEGRTWLVPKKNLIAGLIGLVWYPATANFLKQRRALLAGWLLVALAVEVLSKSRGGWLGFAAGAAFLTVAYWVDRRRVSHVGLVALSAMALVTGIAIVAVSMSDTHNRVGYTAALWMVAWRLFLTSPITGSGPGAFAAAWHNTYPALFPLTHAHSIVFNTLAAWGLVGLIVLVAGLVILGRSLLRRWRQTSDRLPVAALGASLITFLIHNLLDSTYIEPALAFVLAIIIVCALHGDKTSNRAS